MAEGSVFYNISVRDYYNKHKDENKEVSNMSTCLSIT